MTRFILPLAILFGCFAGQAQVRLSITAPDTSAFFFFINDQQINNVLCSSMTIEGVTDGKTTLKIQLAQTTTPTVIQGVTLKPNSQVSYELKQVRGIYKIVPVSEVSLSVSATENTQKTDATSNAVIIDSAVVSKAPSNSQCPLPMDDVTFSSLKMTLSNTHFEIKRFEILHAVFPSHCVNVDQLRYMMARLEMEENKIKLLQSAMGHIYDPERLSTVEADFFLEKNKVRVREILPH